MGECFQWKAIGQCSKGDSCSFSLDTDAIRDKKDNRPLLHQKRKHRLMGRYRQKVQAAEERALLEQKARFRAEISFGTSVRIRHVMFGTVPCVLSTSLNQDALMAKNADSDTLRLMGSPAKKSKKSGVKGSVALLKESIQLGCASHDSYPRKSFLGLCKMSTS